MSTVTLNFRENLELKNNCTYMKYLVLLGTITRAIARDLMPIGAAALLFDNE